MPVANISDTARLAAYVRALESERPDALFRDPYSRRLAGSEGEALAKEGRLTPKLAGELAWRTAVFDELVMQKVRHEGPDLVVNLAAGLDARAWRLDLPDHLRWIDVDLPDILSYKADLMRTERPACVYETEAADLTHSLDLVRLFASFGRAQRIIVVAEGVLMYLKPEQVSELATNLFRQGAIAWWITDLIGPRALAMMQRYWGTVLQGARLQFAPADPAGFFDQYGWRENEFRSSQDEARRLGRAPDPTLLSRIVLGLAPARFREEIRRLAGCVVLERKGSRLAR
jgi:methyltransferase (TIGR00027 family)